MRADARTSSSNTTSSSNRRDWNRSWSSGGPRLRGLDILPPEPLAETPELILLRRRQRRELLDHALDVPREGLADGASPGRGQLDSQAPAVAQHGHAAHEAAFLQLIDEHHHVRPAGEHLGTELARLERTQVQERLEDSELAGREPLLADPDLEAALQRRGTAHQLDQGVERAHLGGVSLVVCAHRILRPSRASFNSESVNSERTGT